MRLLPRTDRQVQSADAVRTDRNEQYRAGWTARPAQEQELGNLRTRQRPFEKISLPEFAVQPRQHRVGFLGLDALRRDGQAERLGERDDPGHDLGLLRVVQKLHHEAPVDLQLVEGQLGQRREAGIPSAEIVQRDPDAEPAQLIDGLARIGEILDHRGLGDLDLQPARRKPGLPQQVGNGCRQSGVAKLLRREVEGKVEPGWPGHGGLASTAQDEPADRVDLPGGFGQRYEAGRRNRPQPRVVPAREDLEADKTAVGHVDNGLEVGNDGAGLDRGGELDLELGRRTQVLAKLVVEEIHAPAALAFCAIHRLFGVPKELLLVEPSAPERDADAGCDHEVLAIHGKLPLHRREHPAGEPGGRVIGAVLAQNDGEFVATEPDGNLMLTTQLPQPFRDALKHPVADLVPAQIVDRLEAVEIHQDHRQRAARPLRRVDERSDHLGQRPPVLQPGQRVVAGDVTGPRLGREPFAKPLAELDTPVAEKERQTDSQNDEEAKELVEIPCLVLARELEHALEDIELAGQHPDQAQNRNRHDIPPSDLLHSQCSNAVSAGTFTRKP
nr:hypothetical protein [Tropicimonas sp. IMCC6043]